MHILNRTKRILLRRLWLLAPNTLTFLFGLMFLLLSSSCTHKIDARNETPLLAKIPIQFTIIFFVHPPHHLISRVCEVFSTTIMTLTVCVGSSGSGKINAQSCDKSYSIAICTQFAHHRLGKTTFLNDVHKSHKCIYIRQYHNLRPYIAVSAISNFDPTRVSMNGNYYSRIESFSFDEINLISYHPLSCYYAQLPYWDLYIKEKRNKDIIVGGVLAGKFMAGLSGGQRKILLFELISQRTALQDNLLIILDEPFAGVTDDFVPFIVERLNEMREKHNVLLVTNDHVETLKKMADNIITVSAINRSKVRINRMNEGVDRNLAILAMAIGDNYNHKVNTKDILFFGRVEFSKHGGIPSIALFAVFMYGLFLITFWGSKPGSEAFILIAAEIISYHIVHPYVLQLVDWRVYMVEEAEALVHSSMYISKLLKAILMLIIIFVVACIQFGCMFATTLGYLNGVDFFFAVLFDNLSQLIPLILLGLYSDLPDQTVQVLGQLPWLFMIFFSTTFSPGAGVDGIKELRYLFSRYYLWCMLPGEEKEMEGCPESNTLLYLIMSSLFLPFLFAIWKLSQALYMKRHQGKKRSSRRDTMKSMGFAQLQLELFGEKALNKLKNLLDNDDLDDLELLASTYRSKQDSDDRRSMTEISSDNGNGDEYYTSDDDKETGEDDNFVSSLLMKLKHIVKSSDLEDLISKHRMECDKAAAQTDAMRFILDGAMGTSFRGFKKDASFYGRNKGTSLHGLQDNDRHTIGTVSEVNGGRRARLHGFKRASISNTALDLLTATGRYAASSFRR